MDRLEKYILENRDRFETQELPLEHRKRFLDRLNRINARETPRKLPAGKPRFSRLMLPAAAALVLALLIVNRNRLRTDNPLFQAEQIRMQVQEIERQIVMLSRQADPETAEDIRLTLKEILLEQVPFDKQLPEDLPAREKGRILQEYYNRKMEAVRSFKLFLAQEINSTDY